MCFGWKSDFQILPTLLHYYFYYFILFVFSLFQCICFYSSLKTIKNETYFSTTKYVGIPPIMVVPSPSDWYIKRPPGYGGCFWWCSSFELADCCPKNSDGVNFWKSLTVLVTLHSPLGHRKLLFCVLWAAPFFFFSDTPNKSLPLLFTNIDI